VGVRTAAGAFVPAAFLSVRNSSVVVLEGPLGPEGDLDGLFAVGGHGGATVASLGEVDNPEIYLRLDPTRARANIVTDGELLKKSI
jgi:hypothetical protein